MALASVQTAPILEGRRWSHGNRTGTRTAADFTITLGFTPTHILVRNLTDRVEALHVVQAALDGGSNAKSLVSVANGDRTYAAAGISLTADSKGFIVDVSVINVETDDDDVYWEAWA